MKLTDEQITELRFAYERAMRISREFWYRREFEAVLAVYEEMIAASETHRIVSAPEGYKFGNIAPPIRTRHEWDGYSHEKYTFQIKPIPAPCPPPKLDPVMALMKVEARYPLGYKLPTGWEIVYQTVGWLKENGFTHCLLDNDFEPASIVATLKEGNFNSDRWPIIGLKKWEDK